MLLSPQGEMFTQSVAQQLMRRERIVLICGRYEGVDERVSEHLADREISVGDFVLSGGELGAAIIVDAVTRLVPGALGNAASAQQESFTATRRMREARAQGAAEFDLRFRRIAGLSALHAAGGVSRDAGSRSAGERQPRRDSALAPAQALQKTLRNRPDLLRASGVEHGRSKLLAEIRGGNDEVTDGCSERLEDSR